MPAALDFTGQRFNHLIAIKRIKLNKKTRYECQCDCGNITFVDHGHLTTNHTKSCGCHKLKVVKLLKPPITVKHGHTTHTTQSRTYCSYMKMIDRCNNKNNEQYDDYGGRGITICDYWRKDFRNFLADMGERPLNTTIDRINNNGNYEKSNCRWATKSIQQYNRRNARNHQPLTNNGVTTMFFDARQYTPEQGLEAHPIGQFPFYITAVERKPSQTPGNEYLNVEFTSPVGKAYFRYNLWNVNAQSVSIATKQLSALCYATGVHMLNDEQRPGSELINAQGQMIVAAQTTKEGLEKGYTQIVRVLDRNGNDPMKLQQGQQGAPQAQQQPQQPPYQQPMQQPQFQAAPVQPAAYQQPQQQPPYQQPQAVQQPQFQPQPMQQAPQPAPQQFQPQPVQQPYNGQQPPQQPPQQPQAWQQPGQQPPALQQQPQPQQMASQPPQAVQQPAPQAAGGNWQGAYQPPQQTAQGHPGNAPWKN